MVGCPETIYSPLPFKPKRGSRSGSLRAEAGKGLQPLAPYPILATTNRIASVATLQLCLGSIPERRSDSSRNMRSASPESAL